MPFLTNPRQEAFAQAYVRGATAGRHAASYLAAGYRVRRQYAAASAWRLMQDAGVRRRIAELQTELAARASAASDSPRAPAPAPTGSTQIPVQIRRGDPMPALANPKHEAFAQAFVRGETAGNRGRSYLAAGYRCKPGPAKTCATRLAKQPDVMRRIAELKQEMLSREAEASERATARLAITKEAVLSELARIAFANLLDYGRPDEDGGFTFNLSKLDRDKAAAIQEVVVTPVAGAGEGGQPKSRVRVKLAGKREALVDLGKHFGLFVARDKGPSDEFADLSDDELAARIRIVVADLQRSGIDVASMFGLGKADGGDTPKGRPN